MIRPIAAHTTNTTLATMLRLTNSKAQPSTASGHTTHTSGVRNGRGRSGCCLRRIITPTATIANASRVPAFEVSASLPTGNSAPHTDTTAPVR